MGIDYKAQLAFGVKLTADEVEKLEVKHGGDHIEEILYDHDDKSIADNLEIVAIGSYIGGDVDYILSIERYDATYEAQKINLIGELDEDDLVKTVALIKFCNENDIKADPYWYHGILQH